MELKVKLPDNCTYLSLLRVMEQNKCFTPNWDGINFEVHNAYVCASAISFLAAWGIHQTVLGRRFSFSGERGKLNYLSRMDLFQVLNLDYLEPFFRHDSRGRFLPILLLHDQNSVSKAFHKICDLIIRTIDNSRDFLPALEWAIYEVMDNILNHAGISTPGVVFAQFFPKKQRLDLSVCDMGRGILNSLSESHNVENHENAIAHAIIRGVTRNSNVGQGNGLAGSLQIMQQNKGNFDIWSGDSSFRFSGKDKRTISHIPTIPGTGILFQFQTNNPVSLKDTFIATDGGWTYFDYMIQNIQDVGALYVCHECNNNDFGTRISARALRLKIESILPDFDGRLLLDFKNINLVTSSFMDELMGKMVEKYGFEELSQKIAIRNLSKMNLNILTNVINQRLRS